MLGPEWTVRDQWACGSEELRPWIDEWQVEVETRYDDYFLVMVHGESIGDEWFVFPDDGPPLAVRALIPYLRQRGVNGRIVLAVCNPEGHRLRAEDVSYATKSVWALPDRFVDGSLSGLIRDWPEDSIGSIDEFIHNP